jgi:hypothetical protein
MLLMTDTDTHERNMRDLATLAARWSADLRVELSPHDVWYVRAVDRQGRMIAYGFSGHDAGFSRAAAACLAELQRVTAEEDAREAEGEVAS